MPSHPYRQSQRGVVLIISLIMLVVISLLATFSIRSASSSEAVAGNVRTTLLATQAAEMALRYCERALASAAGSSPVAWPYPDAAPSINTPALATPRWQTLSNWDSGGTTASVIPLSVVNDASSGSTFSRAPECIIEPIAVANASGTPTETSTFVVTVRGFGPEENGASRTRPTGSEVWLQSTIELQ